MLTLTPERMEPHLAVLTQILGLSANAVARQAGIASPTLHRLKKGHDPVIKHLIRLREILLEHRDRLELEQCAGTADKIRDAVIRHINLTLRRSEQRVHAKSDKRINQSERIRIYLTTLDEEPVLDIREYTRSQGWAWATVRRIQAMLPIQRIRGKDNIMRWTYVDPSAP